MQIQNKLLLMSFYIDDPIFHLKFDDWHTIRFEVTSHIFNCKKCIEIRAFLNICICLEYFGVQYFCYIYLSETDS